ncbi:hypothetical protein JA1_000278 [Spathaspora sp. JA1]|nr:hypothetical protein JA1_000278 [Spathaspora sp. JA1]
MPKRRREEESDDSILEEDTVIEPATGNTDAEFEHIVNQAIRVVLTRETKGQLIRREHINSIITNRKISSDSVLKRVKSILEDVYGLTLVETTSTKTTEVKSGKGGKKLKAQQQPYVVVNCLTLESRNLLGDIWNKSLSTFMKSDDLGKPKYYLPQYTKSKLPTSNFELIKQGILLIILSSVILGENRISETSLLKDVKKFGMPTNLNDRNSNLNNMNIQELLNELIKREYLNRDIIKGRIESENIVEYKLGRRSLIEFSPQSCFEFIKVIFGEKFDSGMAERTLVTIERAYGVALVNESETANTTPSMSRSETPAQE